MMNIKKVLVVTGSMLAIGLIMGLVCSLLNQSNEVADVDNTVYVPLYLDGNEEKDPENTPVDIEEQGGVTPLFHPGDEVVESVSGIHVETEEYKILSFPDNNLDTSDWLTYRSEEYGFELQYPDDWRVKVVRDDTLLIIPQSTVDANDDDGLNLFISKTSLIDFVEQSEGSSGKWLSGSIINNKIKGLVFTTKIGVWSVERGLDTRDTVPNYVFDLGEYRLEYTNYSESYRKQVFEKVLLSLQKI